MRYLYVYFAIFITTSSVYATNWQHNRDDYGTRAATLVRGKSEMQLVVDSRSFDSRKTAAGNQQAIGQDFIQNLNVDGYGAVSREYDISVQQTKWTVGMLHGLTSNWTVGFRLPIVREQSVVKARTYTVQGSGIKVAAHDGAVNTKITEAPTYQAADQIQIGHMEFVGKYLIARGRDLRASILHEVRFPTGETSPTDVVANPTPGAQGYGLGLGMVLDVWPTANWRTGFKLNHAANFSDEVQYRGQIDKEKKHSRDPGDESELGVLLEYNIMSRYFVSAGLSYLTRQADEFNESAVDQNLELGRSERQMAELGVGIMPPDSLRDFPAAAQLRYAILMDGKNTEASNVLSVQTTITF